MSMHMSKGFKLRALVAFVFFFMRHAVVIELNDTCIHKFIIKQSSKLLNDPYTTVVASKSMSDRLKLMTISSIYFLTEICNTSYICKVLTCTTCNICRKGLPCEMKKSHKIPFKCHIFQYFANLVQNNRHSNGLLAYYFTIYRLF